MTSEELNAQPYFICKTTRMLEFLRLKGFIPVQTMPDYFNPKYLVWKFEQTPEFVLARDEWFSMVEEYKNSNK